MMGNKALGYFRLLLSICCWQICNSAQDAKQEVGVARLHKGSNCTGALHQAWIPPGYENISGLGYYRLHTEKRTWGEAQFICQSVGAHLVVINSANEAAAMKKLINRSSVIYNWTWAGFHGILMKGEYLTVFNLPLASSGYANWLPNHPLTTEYNDCGWLNIDARLGTYNCALRFVFICEYEG